MFRTRGLGEIPGSLARRTCVLILMAASAFPGLANTDHRLERLQKFLAGRPAFRLAPDFLRVADQYDLDWRLLPALCVVETSGGKHVRSAHNWFGWNSGRARFASPEEGLETVARHLAEDPLYQGKSTWQKLHIYNRHRSYPAKVYGWMLLVSPAKGRNS